MNKRWLKKLFNKFGLEVSKTVRKGSSHNLANQVIDGLCLPERESELLVWDLLKESLSYPESGGVERLRYYLMLYELYKKILTVPGHIAEIGVFRGFSTMVFGHLIHLFSEVGRHRHIYGFDTFEGYVEKDLATEGQSEALEQNLQDFKKTSLSYVEYLSKLNHYESIIHFIKGDVSESLPRFLESHQDLRFALLFNDCNLYAPTRVVLEAMLPRMVPGGIIYLDSYNNPEPKGETRAADEVLAKYGLTLIKDAPPITQAAYCVIPSKFKGEF